MAVQLSAAAMAMSVAHAQANDLPAGGTVIAGSATITQDGNALVINQTSHKMAADWQRFDIGAGHRVEFVQPSSSSVALNRVIGPDASAIHGALSANGRVFLINPNGVIFGTEARVDVGGLIATTLNPTFDTYYVHEDWFSWYSFQGAGSGEIVNQGQVNVADGGLLALMAREVRNEGRYRPMGGRSGLAQPTVLSLVFTIRFTSRYTVLLPMRSSRMVGLFVRMAGVST